MFREVFLGGMSPLRISIDNEENEEEMYELGLKDKSWNDVADVVFMEAAGSYMESIREFMELYPEYWDRKVLLAGNVFDHSADYLPNLVLQIQDFNSGSNKNKKIYLESVLIHGNPFSKEVNLELV